MKKIIGWIIVLALIGWAIKGCSSIDLEDDNKIKEHLKEYTFEHFEMKASMTSFIQFYETSCKLTIFLNGDFLSETKYNYSIGEKDKDRVNINIHDNSGKWDLKDDGDLYMYNKGELYIYHHKKLN